MRKDKEPRFSTPAKGDPPPHHNAFSRFVLTHLPVGPNSVSQRDTYSRATGVSPALTMDEMRWEGRNRDRIARLGGAIYEGRRWPHLPDGLEPLDYDSTPSEIERQNQQLREMAQQYPVRSREWYAVTNGFDANQFASDEQLYDAMGRKARRIMRGAGVKTAR